MKVAVVQGLQTENIPLGALQNFWIPCMGTVKQWCTINDIDYHFFSKPLDPFDCEELLDCTFQYDKVTRNGQYYKWQWMNSISDKYDVLVWIDSDVYIWGNAPLKWDSTMKGISNSEFYTLAFDKEVGRLVRPHLAIFWASSSVIREIHEWYELMLSEPSARDDYFTTLLTMTKIGILGVDFTEEIALMAWIKENEQRTHMYPVRGRYYPDSNVDWVHCNGEAAKPNSYIHFSGGNKQSNFQKFLAYRAYTEWLSTNPYEEHPGWLKQL